MTSLLPVFLEGQLAIVLAEKVQEPLVLAGFHVEQSEHDLVVAPSLLEALVDEIAHVGAGDLTIHVERIDRRPERLAVIDELLEQIVGDGAAPLASRSGGNVPG